MWTVKTETRASLDDSLTLLCETLERLKAANSGDIVEVIEQLKRAEESACTVRRLVSSELDILIGEIQKSLEAKTVERRRSRLLALVTVLERGRIVHRRAPRRSEVNQLRDQAIKELRSQAEMKGTPPVLPGPTEAGRWIEWACALKEPADAESLQTLRDRFTHLDEFVANLEPDMWIAAEILPEAERSTDKTHQEQIRSETSAFEEPVVSASTLSLVTGLARHFNHPVEPPSPAEAPPVTSAARAPTFDIRTGAEGIFWGKWRMLVVTGAVLVLVLAAVGVIQWMSHRDRTSNGPLAVAESKIPDATPSPPENKGPDQSGASKRPQTHAASLKLQAENQSKPKEQSVAPSPLSKKEEAPPSGATEVADSVPGGWLSGVLDKMTGFLTKSGVAEPKVASQTVWVASGFAQGLLVRQVKPRYPAQARKARIQGTVVLRAEIEKDGSVQDVIALQGHPMLTQAAVDAVKQWRYKPYTLNGEPVEAETRIYLNFTLYDE